MTTLTTTSQKMPAACRHGHAYDEDNMPSISAGFWRCRTCSRLRSRAIRAGLPSPHPRAKPTHCVHGHPYDDTNPPYVKKSGAWACRTCGRIRATQYRTENPKPLKGRHKPWSEWAGTAGYMHVALPPGEQEHHPTARQNGSKNSWRITRSHLHWNRAHPDDLVQPGDEIHHIDGVKTNDMPDNLAKLGKSAHRALHVDEQRKIIRLDAELAEYRRLYGPLPTKEG